MRLMSGVLLLRRLPRNIVAGRACFSTGSSASATRTKTGRPWTTFMAVTAASLIAGTLGAIYPPPPISILFPRPAPAPPAPDTPESLAYTTSLEEKLQSLPIVKEFREKEDAKDWYETRPYQKYPEERRVNHLTVGTLRGPGKLALYPLIRAKRDESEAIIILHLGRGLCGHDGIIHGGLLATLLDETLARNVSRFQEITTFA